MRFYFLFVKIDTSDLEGAKAILRVTAKEERWPRLKNMFTLIFKVWRFTKMQKGKSQDGMTQ